jgi:hypothetical protein
MALKYLKWQLIIKTLSFSMPSKIYPNWDFWSENNKPSGNPAFAAFKKFAETNFGFVLQ